MKEIPLTKGYYAMVDDDDYEELRRYNWQSIIGHNTVYAKRKLDGNTIYMHRVVLGTSPGFKTDHIDGNGLNNQRYNLRLVTDRGNSQNLHMKKSSKYPGVSWNKANRRWYSHIRVGKTGTFLGSFATEIEAFHAYVEACRRLENECEPTGNRNK